jgi:ribosomal protein S16
MTNTTITVKQFMANYEAAEARAVTCAKGKAFSVEDRLSLNAQRKALGFDYTQASALFEGIAGQGKHYNRFNQWDAQIKAGRIAVAPAITGEHVGKVVKVTKQFDDATFDGRIKSILDVQPAFNRAARQLIKVGITNPQEAFKYINTAFETAKVEQKIDLKAERIVKELQMGGMTKDQVMATLARVKQSF